MFHSIVQKSALLIDAQNMDEPLTKESVIAITMSILRVKLP